LTEPVVPAGERLVPAGRVGRPHGRDGSFYVERAGHPLPAGLAVTVAGRVVRIERRAGTDERPLIRLEGAADRSDAEALRGEALLVSSSDAPLEEGEYLSADLVGCSVPGLGTVREVISAPSCDVLDVDGTLVPFVSDAVRRVDLSARVIEVDHRFLDLEPR
jgi:16S rRNA processing protein RimM